MSIGEKELLGAEKALNEFKEGLKGKSDSKDAKGKQQAIEEEFVPVVRASSWPAGRY